MSSRYSRPPNSSLFVRNLPDGTRPRHQVWRVELMMRRDGKASLHGAACKRRFVLESAGPICGKQVLRRTGQAFPSLSETSFERKIMCRDAEDAKYALDKARFCGREIEIEFARGDRKTPTEMRGRQQGDRRRSSSGRSHRDDRGSRRSRSPSRRDRGRRSRSYTRSRSRSRSHSSHGGRNDRPRSRDRSPYRAPERGYDRSRSRSPE